MRLFLNSVLMLTTLLACYVEYVYFIAVPPQIAKVVPFTVRSQGFYTFDQDKALKGSRDIALSKYVPLYRYLTNVPGTIKAQTKDFINEVSFLQKQKIPGGPELIAYVKEAFGLEITRDQADKLLRYRDLISLLKGILTVQETNFQKIIVKDPSPFRDKRTIEVLYPEPKGIVAHATEEVITVEQARLMLKERVRQLFWQVDKTVLDTVLEISQSTLLPNLKYDQKENERRIRELVRHYPSKVIHYDPGDVLVPFRKVIKEEDLLLLVSHHESVKKNLFGNTPWIVLVILLVVMFHDRLLSRIMGIGSGKTLRYRSIISVLITSVCLYKACLLFTPFPVHFVPFAIIPLLIAALNYGCAVSTCATLTGAILLTLFSTRTFEALVFFTLGGWIAVLLSSKIQKRIHVLLPSLAVGIVNVCVVLAFSTKLESIVPLLGNWTETWISSQTMILDKGVLNGLAWAFAGGILAGPVAILLLPLLEVGWHATSSFKLTKYSDLQHPLLKSLFSKIPATYQHSMTMAFLAQAVGEAIGINTLILRIGAYYHDIGKMADPQFFSENQSKNENPHDNLTPKESAQIIIDHVKHGENLGREMGLPEVVLDLIRQHHGTQIVEYFYNKDVEASQGTRPNKEDFRYPGPKPQSIEAAILMIVDAVEATFRSMEAPTREEIRKMIRLHIVKRIADGQFDECNLSTQNIGKIVETLSDSIEATFHSRISYPWQEKK